MRPAVPLILTILAVGLVACQPTAQNPDPKIPDQTQPVDPARLTPADPPSTRKVDPRTTLLIKGMVFFLTDEEEKSLGLSGDQIESEFLKIPEDQRNADLEALRGDGTAHFDAALAAASLLPFSEENARIYKDLLLSVPTAFANNTNSYDQAYEAWGDLAADFVRTTKDREVLLALYTHSFDGAAAEIVAAARVELLTENPEFVLANLNDVQLTELGTILEVGSPDVETTVNRLIEVENGPDKTAAQAAKKVLAAFEAQQKSDQIESQVP